MGIPAFFRWLQKKYQFVVEPVQSDTLDPATRMPYWCDNLYLDMNGIIHPCTHPEDKPPPETEDEMFEAIFEYTEMLMEMVKPRNLVYMAIDGVAPRAKMNQQRSRRFRAVQESEIKQKEIQDIRDKLRAENIEPQKSTSKPFDSNVITPGTTFMSRLTEALQKWIQKKLSTPDEKNIWHKNLHVILSDASVPGEGEHKIMDYIRKQKNLPTFNPSLRHCLCGADADLIMLGLSTHLHHFMILREEFKPNQQRPCDLCKQYGHSLKDCRGTLSIKEAQDKEVASGNKTDFIYINLFKLRELLNEEMRNESSLQLDFERFVDDFIFLCFFVGNDFLPHLPCLEIRENAIDRLLRIYHQVHRESRRANYLNENGNVNLRQCQEILRVLGRSEEYIFVRRTENDTRYNTRLRQNKKAKWQQDNNNFNDDEYPEPSPEPEDLVRLGEYGWKDRYYSSKFGVSGRNVSALTEILTREYVRGLCWVLEYYFKGCPDWQWFYPFHYAPFAQDMRDLESVRLNFNRDAPPFSPLEQLMSVFPEKSADALPKSWRKLMSDPTSPIIDFYPTDFKIDLNGKKAAWMGVALLPFIDEARLFDALKQRYADLTEEEIARNSTGEEQTFRHSSAGGR